MCLLNGFGIQFSHSAVILMLTCTFGKEDGVHASFVSIFMYHVSSHVNIRGSSHLLMYEIFHIPTQVFM